MKAEPTSADHARAIVSARGAARWRAGHPWIYRSDLRSAPDVPAGAVRVEEQNGRRVGTALWSPASQISLRMLTREHRSIDAAFWRERIERAAAYREALSPDADAYRVVHAEADGLPSLIVDRYAGYLSVQLLSAGLEAFRENIVDALVERLAPEGIVARNDVPVRAHEELAREVEILHGDVPPVIEVREGRVRYQVELREGQKTGAFLDQRENRTLAAELARGRALDCFSYHGSFALHLATGAREVVAVDSSVPALQRGQENASLNGFDNIEALEANAFDYLRAGDDAGERWDVIVVDPPAFAKDRRSLDAALRGYKELNLRAMRMLVPGGHLLTFSCSYHVDDESFAAMLASAAADSGRPMRLLRRLAQAADHPAVLQIPESSYLKGALLQAM
jgi:23S rRNA (cytosine1962-C5)-methyltransferase